MTAKGCERIRWMITALIFLTMGINLASAGEEVPCLTKEELKEMLSKPDIIIIDVRSTLDWQESDQKILGAVREEPDKGAKSWAEKYPKDKAIVLYCAWPSEATSARVAQELISLGFKKVYALKGGWKDWSKANFPTEAK